MAGPAEDFPYTRRTMSDRRSEDSAPPSDSPGPAMPGQHQLLFQTLAQRDAAHVTRLADNNHGVIFRPGVAR